MKKLVSETPTVIEYLRLVPEDYEPTKAERVDNSQESGHKENFLK